MVLPGCGSKHILQNNIVRAFKTAKDDQPPFTFSFSGRATLQETSLQQNMCPLTLVRRFIESLPAAPVCSPS